MEGRRRWRRTKGYLLRRRQKIRKTKGQVMSVFISLHCISVVSHQLTQIYYNIGNGCSRFSIPSICIIQYWFWFINRSFLAPFKIKQRKFSVDTCCCCCFFIEWGWFISLFIKGTVVYPYFVQADTIQYWNILNGICLLTWHFNIIKGVSNISCLQC